MKENTKYSLFQGFYYTGFCTGQGFCAYYLGKYGYSFGKIGIITAVSCLFASLIQIISGRLLDKRDKFNWKNTTLFFIILYIISSLGLYITKKPVFAGIFMGIGIMVINAMTPVVNSISFYYQEKGKNVNFGIARGIGSLTFAICSVILGRLTLNYGYKMVPLMSVIMSFCMLFIFISMPYEKNEVYQKIKTEKKERGKKENLLAKYPGFFMMAAGITLFYTFHNMYCTYLINIVENAGGNTRDYGIAMAMAAVFEIPVMFLSSRLVKRFSSAFLLIVCGLAFALKGVIFLLAGNMFMVYSAQALQLFSYALIASVTVYFADETMKEDDKVTGQSVMTIGAAIGSVFGNFFGGIIISAYGINILLISGIFITIAGVVLAVLSFMMIKREKNICAGI